MTRLSLLINILLVSSLLLTYSYAEDDAIGGDFELTTHMNEKYSSLDSRGKVILLFFGFTHCPDVCPNTLSTVQTVLAQLENHAMFVQPLLISVDPKRDKPEILKEYLKYFGNNFIGLTGTVEEIDKVIKQFRGFYKYEGNVNANNYTVDHTSSLYIINTEGQVTNIMPYGLPPQAITDVVRKLVPESAS